MIYIDDARIPYRGMLMSHLIADDLEELHSFAQKLGLKREWFQDKRVPHYDVSDGKRKLAIRLGAQAETNEAQSEAFRALKRTYRRNHD
jgi:hypothetical protein